MRGSITVRVVPSSGVPVDVDVELRDVVRLPGVLGHGIRDADVDVVVQREAEERNLKSLPRVGRGDRDLLRQRLDDVARRGRQVVRRVGVVAEVRAEAPLCRAP